MEAGNRLWASKESLRGRQAEGARRKGRRGEQLLWRALEDLLKKERALEERWERPEESCGAGSALLPARPAAREQEEFACSQERQGDKREEGGPKGT